jgi:hypothetical protein
LELVSVTFCTQKRDKKSNTGEHSEGKCVDSLVFYRILMAKKLGVASKMTTYRQ